MKTLLLLATIVISLASFLLFTVSGALLGKDTRSKLPKWISGAATVVVGGYFALVEWDSFVSAWNRHILGVETAESPAQPRIPANRFWSVFDMTTLPHPVAASSVISETDPRITIWCGLGHAVIGLDFFRSAPEYQALMANLGPADQKTYSVGFRLADGQLIVLPGLFQQGLPGSAGDAVSFMITTVPEPEGAAKGMSEAMIGTLDRLLDAIMVQETDFTLRISDGSTTWTGTTSYPTEGLSRMWKTAASTAAASGTDNRSAACRAAMAG